MDEYNKEDPVKYFYLNTRRGYISDLYSTY